MKSFQSVITLECAFCYWMQHRNIPIWLSSVLSHPSSLTPKADSCWFENLNHFWQDSGPPLQLYYHLVSGSCRRAPCCYVPRKISLWTKLRPNLVLDTAPWGGSWGRWQEHCLLGKLELAGIMQCKNDSILVVFWFIVPLKIEWGRWAGGQENVSLP